MSVRHATSADIEAIHQLGTAVDEFVVNEQTVDLWPKEILATAVQNSEVPILVAEEDGAIVGFVIANYNPGLRKAIIENICAPQLPRSYPW
jgi:L-amino acid N-acyltransferase YncA